MNIKKILSFALTITILAAVTCLQTVAAQDGDFIVKDGILVRYTGPGGKVSIPDNLGITEIGTGVFHEIGYSHKLQSIIIPNSVTQIGEQAFDQCTQLSSVTLPETLTSIGDSAFRSCSKLSNINIPETVDEIGVTAFSGTALSKPILINNEKILCYVPASFVSYDIPNTVAKINSAFYNCTLLKSVKIPDSVTYIGDYSFAGCSNLKTLNIPNSVKAVGTSCFNGIGVETPIYICDGTVLCNVSFIDTHYVIPNTVTVIAGGCFRDHAMSFIKIPDSVKIIEDNAFSWCRNLTAIQLSNNITRIGKNAFTYCDKLESIDLPKNLTSIEEGTFSYCKSLSSISIPACIQTIQRCAFQNCQNLKILNLSFGLNAIMDQSFLFCTSLVSIDIPESVYFIDMSAFGGCTSLTSVTIPDSVTYLSESAFLQDWNLTIYGSEYSFLQKYANDGGLKFKSNSVDTLSAPVRITIVVNGKRIMVEAYNINGSNYFKLRDLATMLQATNKSFNVIWNSSNNSMDILSGTAYVPIGNELQISTQSCKKLAVHTTSAYFLDGKQIGMVAYKIDDFNYFKLRDIAYYLNFSIEWDSVNKSIIFDTSRIYEQ